MDWTADYADPLCDALEAEPWRDPGEVLRELVLRNHPDAYERDWTPLAALVLER